ncbi:MAG: hypothetical protein SVE93_00020 [Candidatus Thermoplasmatota archaeon]|nr:hypothetical protein [Candidatus Thermoplasmatota archaeon]
MLKNRSILMMALLVLLVPVSTLQHSEAQMIDDVETGWRGLIDVSTNIRNLWNFGKSAVSDLMHLDFRSVLDTMRDFPENAGQTAGIYLFWIGLLALISIILIPISPILYISSGYLIFSNSGGLLHYTAIAQMIGAIPILNLLVIPFLLINPILQLILIVSGRGGSGAGEPIIDLFVTITAPEEVLEGEEFMVLATLGGDPLPDTYITLGNETVITDIYGMAALKAPEVVEDTIYTIYAGGEVGKGSVDILVKNSPGLFEFGENGVSLLPVVVLIIVLVALLVALAIFSRGRRNA